MTLIAGFSKDGCHLLLGDLLLSNSAESSKKLTLPTVGELSAKDIAHGKYLPSGLTQKVNLLSPKLAIAWTGKLFDAKIYLGEVYASGLHKNPSSEALIDIYENMGADKELSTISYYRNDKEMCLFDINTTQVPLPNDRFNYFKAAGTGYDGLLNTLGRLGKTEVANPIRKLTKLEVGLVEAMKIGSSLISEEIDSQQTIKELYGAGYEFAHPLKDEIAKFTDFSYICWTTKELEPGIWGINPVPIMVMKYSYLSDILVIRSVRFSPSSQPFKVTIYRDELHFINPIYRIITDDELIGYTPPSLNSKYFINIFFCENHRGERTGVYHEMGLYNEDNRPLIFTNEFTKQEGVSINMNFIQKSIKNCR